MVSRVTRTGSHIFGSLGVREHFGKQGFENGKIRGKNVVTVLPSVQSRCINIK